MIYIPGAALIIFAVIIFSFMAWPRCITANHANLSWQDHQDRIHDWKDWLLIVVVVGFCYGTTLSLSYLLTGNQLWATWCALGLALNFGVFCCIIFMLQLHMRHQAKKLPAQQTTSVGK